VEMTCV